MKTPTRHTHFAVYLILGLLFSGLLLSSCEREEKTCVEKDRTYLDTPLWRLMEYENNIFSIYKGNDTLRLKESSTDIIHTFTSDQVRLYYTYNSDSEPDDKCLRYTKYENKKIVFYQTDNKSELSISIKRERSGWEFFIYFQRVPFYCYSVAFIGENFITYKQYTIDGTTYKNVYKIIANQEYDSSFNDYYALYNKADGLLEIKLPGGNTFSRVP
jgi:hypothetical protein